MIHEQDVAQGGCEFSVFFEQAIQNKPLQALIDGGLFQQLALPLLAAGPFRRLSVRHIHIDLGARVVRRNFFRFGSKKKETNTKTPAQSWAAVKKVNDVLRKV